SEETAREIDAEVRRIVIEEYKHAHEILKGQLEALKKVAEALLEHETIDGDDIDVVLRGGKIERVTSGPPRPPALPAETAKEKRPLFGIPAPILKDEPEKA